MRVKPQAEEGVVNDFLDLARVRQGMRSDRELAEALQVGSPRCDRPSLRPQHLRLSDRLALSSANPCLADMRLTKALRRGL
jgi:hypothetical protein